MLPSPSSSPPRPILINRTNFNPIEKRVEKQQQILNFFPTPPKYNGVKRTLNTTDNEQHKRLRLEDVEDDSDGDEATRRDAAMDVVLPSRRRTVLFPTQRRRRPLPPSTRPILESFVSASKLDAYTCQSEGLIIPPIYASSYSHASKRGESSILAVANEHGTVHILNTKKRDPWDPEPPRTVLQPHHNGIFDVKWSELDEMLATASADYSISIISIPLGANIASLRGHTSTVKCIDWDPSNPNLLATGGRDGTINFWDLRITENEHDGSLSPVASVAGAHEELNTRKRQKGMKSVTSLIYRDDAPYNLVSSGTADGKLRCWDIRLLQRRRSAPKPRPIIQTLNDPTCLHGSRRPRGIKSLCKGTGPTSGVLFGFSADSRVHTYSLSSLIGYDNSYMHPGMQNNSFYVGLSTSPCGRWLSCGGPTGNAFLFDVEDAGSPASCPTPGVQLGDHQTFKGEIGSVSWSAEGLATSSDEGVVRIWRPDVDIHRRCQEDPEAERWHWDWAV